MCSLSTVQPLKPLESSSFDSVLRHEVNWLSRVPDTMRTRKYSVLAARVIPPAGAAKLSVRFVVVVEKEGVVKVPTTLPGPEVPTCRMLAV